jgi:hypothetical protein
LAAVPYPGLLARAFDQDSAHGLGSGGEEMAAPVPADFVGFGEAQPGFMHKGGGLEGLAGRFLSHTRGGQLAQFIIDQRQQFLRSPGFTLLNAIEDLRDLAHGPTMRPCEVVVYDGKTNEAAAP